MRIAVAALLMLSGVTATTWSVERRDPIYDDDGRVLDRIRHPPKTVEIPADVALPYFESAAPLADPRSLTLTISPHSIRFPTVDGDADNSVLTWARRHFLDEELLVVADSGTTFGRLARVFAMLEQTGWRWRIAARQALGGIVAVALPRYVVRRRSSTAPVVPHLDLVASIRPDRVVITANTIVLDACGSISECAASAKRLSPDFVDEQDASIAADPSTPLQRVLDVVTQLQAGFPIVSLRFD